MLKISYDIHLGGDKGRQTGGNCQHMQTRNYFFKYPPINNAIMKTFKLLSLVKYTIPPDDYVGYKENERKKIYDSQANYYALFIINKSGFRNAHIQIFTE